MAIDLRNPQGEFGGSFQAASDILASIQKANKAKADRNTLNEISKARALNPNASIDEILAGLPQAQEASGLAGIIQRITGAGQSTVIPELQASRITTPTQEASIRASDALTASRTAGKTTPAFKKTSEEIQRDRDIKFLDDDKGLPFQKKEARDRLKALPLGNLVRLEPSKENDKGFVKLTRLFIGEIKPTATRKTKKGFTDKIFGQADFETLVNESINESLKEGIRPASVRPVVLEWWTRQFEKEKDQPFQKFQNPAEFQQSPEEIIQQAADEGLLTPEDVQSITTGIQADPSKLQDVIDMIERKRRGE